MMLSNTNPKYVTRSSIGRAQDCDSCGWGFKSPRVPQIKNQTITATYLKCLGEFYESITSN